PTRKNLALSVVATVVTSGFVGNVGGRHVHLRLRCRRDGARLLLARRHPVQGVGAAVVEEGLTLLELDQTPAPTAVVEPNRRRAAADCADKCGQDNGEPDVDHGHTSFTAKPPVMQKSPAALP